jgi:hypothetical protein
MRSSLKTAATIILSITSALQVFAPPVQPGWSWSFMLQNLKGPISSSEETKEKGQYCILG